MIIAQSLMQKEFQPKYNASCNITNTVTICNNSYPASDRYKFNKCFEIYGGISSQNKTELGTTPSCPINITPRYVIAPIFILFIVFIFVIGYFIRKYNQNDITYPRYIGEAGRAFKNCIVQIACGPGPNNDTNDAALLGGL